MKGRLISIATAGVLLAVAAVTPALAGSHSAKRYPTTIKIKADQAAGLLTGGVTSEKKPCFQHAKVLLKVNGEELGDDTATAGGHYKFDFGGPISSGKYEVHTLKVRVNDKVVCAPGNSKIVTIG